MNHTLKHPGSMRTDGSAEIKQILCKVGDQVNEEDIVLILETEEHQLHYSAGVKGTVSIIHVKVKDTVFQNDVLVSIEVKD